MSVRAVDVIRTALGVARLVQPPVTVFGRPATCGEVGVLRFLGARQVVQAVVTERTGWRALGAVVDLLHGGSMVLLAVLAPKRYGRPATVQAVEAGALVVLGVLADRRDG